MTSTTNGYQKQLTEDQIQSIEEMAELFYDFHSCCIAADLDAQDFTEDFYNHHGQFYTAYMRGYLKGDIALRQSIKKSADNGSHPAQTLLLKLQEDANINTKANE